jgi:hypothetical protein
MDDLNYHCCCYSRLLCGCKLDHSLDMQVHYREEISNPFEMNQLMTVFSVVR